MQFANTSPNGQITRWVLIAFGIIIGAFALWLVRDIVMLTLTSAILAILLTTPVRFFVKVGIRRPFAIVLSILLIIVLIVAAGWLVFPALTDQFTPLLTRVLPNAAQQIAQESTPEKLVVRFPFLSQEDALTISRQISGGLTSLAGLIFPVVGSLATTLLNILIVLFLSLYFIADPTTHQRGIIKLIPLHLRPRAYQILVKLDETLRRFLQAQIILMIMIGVGTGIALALMGIPLPVALGTITGVFSFVPNFGPLISLVPILAVGIINTPDKLLLIVVVYYILQTIQSQVIAPLLLGQGIHMPPAMILLSQIIAGIFFGFLGVLLAVPLAAIAMVLVQEIYVKDILGDSERNETRSSSDVSELVPDSI